MSGGEVTKLPVMATVGNAYRLLGEEWLTVLRFAWFPFLVAYAFQYVATRFQYQAMRAAVESGRTGDITRYAEIWWLDGTVTIISCFAFAMVAVAVHRLILFGDRQRGRFVPLAFGRVGLLFVALPLAGIAIVVVIVLGGGFIGAGFASWPKQTGLAVAILFGGFVVAAWLIARLSLLFPLAVVERRLDFRRSWTLTRGNALRIVGIWVVGSIPLAVIGLFVALIIKEIYVTRALPDLLKLDQSARVLRVIEINESVLPATIIINYLLSIFGTALGVAFLSYSYKALTGRAPEDMLPRPSS